MKILIVTQYYYPENFKSNDLSFELKKRGHAVTVLTGLPNYPEGKVYNGYGVFKNRKQIINGVKVVRSLVLPRGNGSGLRLFLNYYSFAFFASIKAFILGFRENFDAIIVHEPSPITQFYPALLINKIWKTPIYFWVMDLWPESIQVAGNIQNKLILNYYKNLAIKFYKKSKKILITSKGFAKSIIQKGDFGNKIEYFPNWAEETISSKDNSYQIPKLPQGFKIMFAGNVGEAQDMESVLKAALMLKDQTDIKFIIVGSGRKMPFVEDYIEKNKLKETVICLGRFPVEAMSTFFSKADVMLVSLKDDPIFNLTVPAKVQAYMSSSKPIIAMLNGEGADIVKEAECGAVVEAGTPSELANTLLNFYHLSSNDLNRLGLNGFRFFVKNYSLSACMDNLERILNAR